MIFRSLPHERLAERTTIQGYDVTVLKAILHVVEHFSGHTAQIIFITKMVTGEDLFEERKNFGIAAMHIDQKARVEMQPQARASSSDQSP